MTQPATIPEAVRGHAARGCPSRLRFGRAAACMDYAALWREVEAKLAQLAAADFRAGQRVATSMSNTLEAVSTVLAVMHAGGTVIPLFHRQGMRATGKDHARIIATLRVSRAPLAFTHAADLAVLREATTAAGREARVFAYEAPSQAAGERVPEPRGRGAPALIQFSAGSTSQPKGLCLGHAQLVANVAAIGQRLELTDQDRVCSWLPLFHDMGLIGALFTTLYAGASLTLFSPAEFVREPLAWIEQLSRDRSTITQAPQFAYDLCLQKAALQAAPPGSYDLSALRVAMNGAEAVDAAACDRFEAWFGAYGLRAHVIQPCYGLAENCVAVTLRAPGTPRATRHFERAALSRGVAEPSTQPTAASVLRAGNGVALEGTRVSVLTAAGEPAAEGCIGELAIAGAATTTALLGADGVLEPLGEWVRTGDLGLFVDGELYVVGRVKEVVKRGGEAFSPTDIEACVASSLKDAELPHVLGIGAFGYRDEASGGEEIVVVLETREVRNAARAGALANHARRVVLREFRLPLRDVVVARPGTIPRTTSGKLQRLALRDRYVRGELEVARAAAGPVGAGT